MTDNFQPYSEPLVDKDGGLVSPRIFVVTNIEVEAGPSLNEYKVESYFIIYQSRLETKEALFVGYRSDRLRRVNGELKIAGRKIVLDSGILATS